MIRQPHFADEVFLRLVLATTILTVITTMWNTAIIYRQVIRPVENIWFIWDILNFITAVFAVATFFWGWNLYND